MVYSSSLISTDALVESTDRRICASGGGGGARSSVCLGGLWLVDRTFSTLSSLPDRFSLGCLSRACRRAFRSAPCILTARAFYGGGSCLLQVVQVSSLSDSPQQRPRVSVSADPLSAGWLAGWLGGCMHACMHACMQHVCTYICLFRYMSYNAKQ